MCFDPVTAAAVVSVISSRGKGGSTAAPGPDVAALDAVAEQSRRRSIVDEQLKRGRRSTFLTSVAGQRDTLG